MGWINCPCEYELSYPTVDEIIDENMICPRCNLHHDPMVDKDELLKTLFERVQVLEDVVSVLAEGRLNDL